MSVIGLMAVGAAAGAVWLDGSDRFTAVRRLRARTAPTGRLGAVLGRAWPQAMLAATATALLLGPVAGVLAAAAVPAGRRALRAVRAGADRDRAAAAIAGACGVLAAELRAGRPQDAALALAAEDLLPPTSDAVRRAVVSARLGGDVPAALLAAQEGAGDAGGLLLRQLAACWQVAGRTGAGLAGVVDAFATDLRARERLRLETNAALAGPRTTAWLLAGLPAVGVAMAAGFGASPARVLLRTPAGLACLVLGTVLDLLGVLWTRRLVRRALDPR